MTRSLVQGLRVRGIDVRTVFDAGLEGREDAVQLEYAAAHRRALFTFNVGAFSRLHSECQRQGKSHAGIVVAPRQRLGIGQQVRGLAQLTSEELTGRLLCLKA